MAVAAEHHLEPPANHTDSSLIDLSYHQGPLPSPADFAAYEQAFPGTADRILAMAERDQIAVLRDRDRQRTSLMRADLVSQVFLFALVAAAVYLAIHDKPLEAFFAGLAPMAIAIYANTRKLPNDNGSDSP